MTKIEIIAKIRSAMAEDSLRKASDNPQERISAGQRYATCAWILKMLLKME